MRMARAQTLGFSRLGWFVVDFIFQIRIGDQITQSVYRRLLIQNLPVCYRFVKYHLVVFVSTSRSVDRT